MIDRRISPRAEMDMPAVIHLPLEERLAFAAIQNVSVEGFCFLTKEKIRTFDRFSFNFELSGEKLSLNIEPRWMRENELLSASEYRVGARITNTTTPSFARYMKFVKDLRKTSAKHSG